MEKDVIVVGSGASGMVAALAAYEQKLDVLLIESTSFIGGNSAISGGGVWIPNNHVIRNAGVEDSYEQALKYLNLCVGDVGPASSAQRREAFLTEGPKAIKWLESLGMQWVFTPGYSDYYPDKPGAMVSGRGVEAKKYNLKRLGQWADKLRASYRVPIHTSEVKDLYLSKRSIKSLVAVLKVFVRDALIPLLRGELIVGLGNALMGRLFELILKRKIEFWLESPLHKLVINDGRVEGLEIKKQGKSVRVQARRGVIFASGGFEKNAKMRQEHQESPIGADWTAGSEGNLGHPINLARDAGAALALMNEAWWGPSVVVADTKETLFLVPERSMPFCFIVGQDGKRFMNESESYVDAGHHQYERNRIISAIPAWMILDSRHRKYYPFASFIPGWLGTKKLLNSGTMVAADSIAELADKIGVDPAGLTETTQRFNGFARTGHDLDFNRGGNAYDRVYSDPKVKPNPNLGSVEKPPFYAIKIYPGDIGTKGGLLTDEYARVLREDGTVINGLYAAGNCSASVMGRTYPGAGSTLGPAITFGYIAGTHLATENSG